MDRKKLATIALAAVLAIVVIVNVISFFTSSGQEGTAISTGSFTRRPYDVTNDSWRVRSSRANGYSRVDYTFSAADLAAMHVNSRNSIGNIRLIFIQGDIERTIDISNEFYGYIDMSGFEPGEIRLRLDFIYAEQINTTISWGE